MTSQPSGSVRGVTSQGTTSNVAGVRGSGGPRIDTGDGIAGSGSSDAMPLAMGAALMAMAIGAYFGCRRALS
jgi:hypothetical protein